MSYLNQFLFGIYPYVALEQSLSRVIEDAYVRKARGEDYYVGPRCPPETLKKLGLDGEGNAVESEPPMEPAQIDPELEAPAMMKP